MITLSSGVICGLTFSDSVALRNEMLVAPLLVPWLAKHWGWQGAFIATGAVGFLWVAAWAWLYQSPEKHPRVSAAELAYIRKDPVDPEMKIPWLELLRHLAGEAGKGVAGL